MAKKLKLIDPDKMYYLDNKFISFIENLVQIEELVFNLLSFSESPILKEFGDMTANIKEFSFKYCNSFEYQGMDKVVKVPEYELRAILKDMTKLSESITRQVNNICNYISMGQTEERMKRIEQFKKHIMEHIETCKLMKDKMSLEIKELVQ